MDQIEREVEPKGLSRRTVVTAAAWSAPVIALASAAPMAAASPESATLSALAGGVITANNAAGTANGSLEGGLLIGNVLGGPWETGTIQVDYVGTGPWSTFGITKPGGASFIDGETIVHGGVTWTVSLPNARTVRLTAPSETVSSNTTISAPPANFSGTFTSGVPDEFNPIGGTVRVSAANINGGNTVSAGQTYP